MPKVSPPGYVLPGKRTIRGNVLFLILLAVVLFAALSYAVTSSVRGGGNDATKENAKALAAEIVQYATLIETTIQRLMLTNGCTDTQISFWNDSNGDGIQNSSDEYYNSLAPADKRCHVFNPNGGNVPAKMVPTAALDTAFSAVAGYGRYYFVRSVQVEGVGTTGCGAASCTDLTLHIFGLSDAVCQEISKQFLGYDGLYTAVVYGESFHTTNTLFTGWYSYWAFSDNGRIGQNPASYDEANLYGMRTMCFKNYQGVLPMKKQFIHVLIAR